MVTNDGATILKSIALDNAAAKVRPGSMVDIGIGEYLQSPG
jgi:hypothetical protein